VEKAPLYEQLYETYTNRIPTVYGFTVFCTNDIRHRVRHRVRHRRPFVRILTVVYRSYMVPVSASVYMNGMPIVYGPYTFSVYLYTNGIRHRIQCRIRCSARCRIYRSYEKTYIRVRLVYGSYTFRITALIQIVFFPGRYFEMYFRRRVIKNCAWEKNAGF